MNIISKDKILEIVNYNLEDTSIQIEQFDLELDTVGMDSITFIKIIVDLEESFELEIPDEFLLLIKMNTINKMYETLSFVSEKKLNRTI